VTKTQLLIVIDGFVLSKSQSAYEI